MASYYDEREYTFVLFYPADANSNQNEGANTGGNKSAASKDIHNDTTVSDISADITMDSVKDHTM